MANTTKPLSLTTFYVKREYLHFSQSATIWSSRYN